MLRISLSDHGCGLKIAIIDGNEKNRRKICMAPKEHVSENIGRANFYKLCTGSPALGTKSRFCSIHTNLEKKSPSKPSPSQNDLRPVTRMFAKESSYC